MAIIYIDTRPYEVDASQNLLQACLSLKLNLPYFCWHPAMHSVGACRQCAVKLFKNEKDTKGRIVMACMTPAADGTRISIDDPEARQFRAGVIEFLMVNHPHDCPVCDEGGECHLQDMTLMTGHTVRRYRFGKRTYRNQNLGPLVTHEMNRCIACYRCVRFYRDYAGGRDFGVFGWHDTVYFGRRADGTLESEFAGNLVEVCPTGVFTDKTLAQHYTRKWDLQTAPSVCVHCSLGCNTIPGERYGTLRRIRNRYHRAVNGYFLCDRGRYGYEFVNRPERIRVAGIRAQKGGTLAAAGCDQVVAHVAAVLQRPKRVFGIGSPRAALEANFALQTLVGPERYCPGMANHEARLVAAVLEVLRRGPVRTASLHETEQAGAVLVLGEDLINTAPVLGLAVRQASLRQQVSLATAKGIPAWSDNPVREVIQGRPGPVFLATLAATKLDDAARQVYHAPPTELVRFVLGVAAELGAVVPRSMDLPESVRLLAHHVAEQLRHAANPLVISGTSLGSESLIRAAADIAWALRAGGNSPSLTYVVPECNSLGAGLMGGCELSAVAEAAHDGKVDTLLVLENDLFRRGPHAEIRALLETVPHVIVLDHLATPTTDYAEAVLPAATFAESDGTLVNNEGRGQRFYQVFVPQQDIRESWRWLRDVMRAAGRSEAEAWQNLDGIIAAMGQTLPALAPVAKIAPPAGFRIAGQKIARQTHRTSGRTAAQANISIQEIRPPNDPDTPLDFSMEGFHGQPPATLIPRFWTPRWNSIQSVTRFQEEVNGPLRGGDSGVRLIEPEVSAEIRYFTEVPQTFQPRPEQWLAVPLYHVFGSEPLSTHSPGIAELVPPPYLALNPEDAAAMEMNEGQPIDTDLVDQAQSLPVRYVPSLPRGLLGVPVGLPGVPWFGGGARWVTIRKAQAL